MFSRTLVICLFLFSNFLFSSCEQINATTFKEPLTPPHSNVTILNGLIDKILYEISRIHVQTFNDISLGNLSNPRRQICVLTNAFYQCQIKIENVTMISPEESNLKMLSYYFTLNLSLDQSTNRFSKINFSPVEVSEYQRPSKYLISSLIRQFYNRVYYFYVRPSSSAVTSASMVSHALKVFFSHYSFMNFSEPNFSHKDSV